MFKYSGTRYVLNTFWWTNGGIADHPECFCVCVSICKGVTVQGENKGDRKRKWGYRNGGGQQGSWSQLRRAAASYCPKWNFWFLCLIGVSCMSTWSQVLMKAGEVSRWDTMTCSAQPWGPTSQEVFPAKGVKRKTGFLWRKAPVLQWITFTLPPVFSLLCNSGCRRSPLLFSPRKTAGLFPGVRSSTGFLPGPGFGLFFIMLCFA